MTLTEAPRRRAPDVRPAQILDAAFHEFGERGLAGARLDDIAKRAGVAKGTIYLYFPTKEALFRDMVHTTIVATLAEAESTKAGLPSETAAAHLRRLGQGWWTYLRTERMQVLQRLVLLELSQFPDLMHFYAEDVIARGRRVVSGIIARGVARGEFRAIDPQVAARQFSAIWMAYSTWCARRELFQTPGTDEQVLDEMLEFYLSALRP
jgi:AcrR family transcriptional regulator